MKKRFPRSLKLAGPGGLALALSVSLAACSEGADGMDPTDSSAGGDGTTGSGGQNGNDGGPHGSGGANGSGGQGPGPGGSCAPRDECFFDAGLEFACKRRFATGLNYAWHFFAGDFGGITPWSQAGVSNNAAVDAELGAIRAAGASVLRWWMFPDFRGNGVLFDGGGDPTGLTEAAVADIERALELADKHDLYIVFTIFSFDNFRPTYELDGINIRSMTPMVTNPTRRARLIEDIVRPAARAVQNSPHADRLLGWDVINEPEWAVLPVGSAPGGQDFTPNNEVDPVPLSDMKALINDSLAVLAEETPNALKSVGWAAAKWVWAFSDVTNVDFHQPHIYAWANPYWPYTSTPEELGYGDKPTVMGEYYLVSMPFAESGEDATLDQIHQSWFDSGYAGAWPWQYFDYGENLPLFSSFARSDDCRMGY